MLGRFGLGPPTVHAWTVTIREEEFILPVLDESAVRLQGSTSIPDFGLIGEGLQLGVVRKKLGVVQRGPNFKFSPRPRLTLDHAQLTHM